MSLGSIVRAFINEWVNGAYRSYMFKRKVLAITHFDESEKHEIPRWVRSHLQMFRNTYKTNNPGILGQSTLSGHLFWGFRVFRVFQHLSCDSVVMGEGMKRLSMLNTICSFNTHTSRLICNAFWVLNYKVI